MIRALWTASTGMTAQALKLDVIANNIANVNTTGFKRVRAHFEDLMYQIVRTPGADASAAGTQVPTGIQVGMGVQTAGTEFLFSEGNLKQTGNPLDLAIQGRGFFEILLPNGETAYTRAGSFTLDAQGRIVTQDGDVLQPGLVVPPDALAVHVARDGTVSVEQPGGVQSVIGRIQLVDFLNPAGLKAIGGGLFQATNASGEPIVGNPNENGFGAIAQGMLETSNVNVVEEMVDMIASQRAYEMNAKAIQAADEMLQAAGNIRR